MTNFNPAWLYMACGKYFTRYVYNPPLSSTVDHPLARSVFYGKKLSLSRFFPSYIECPPPRAKFLHMYFTATLLLFEFGRDSSLMSW